MSSESVISVKNVGKSYHIYSQPRDRLKQFLFRGKRQYFREFWALKDVNLDIKQGEVLGVIGRNGAGKSTLLQLLCGTLAPTHGEVVVKGRVAALLELGAGFNPEFTGRENIFMNAAILGLSKQEIESKFNEIVEMDGAILTKADVDEKGGAPLSIAYTIKKPILFLGMGQEYKDFEAFDKNVILERLGF